MLTERDSTSLSTAFESAALGIMAYNEEANIAHLLESVLRQTALNRLSRIVVIASGCTDRTAEIAASFQAKDARIEVIVEQERRGKVNAINRFLALATDPILIISSADLILHDTTLERLLAPFVRSDVGMTGAHPVPLNSEDHFVGFIVHCMWELHHRISLEQPRMGELIAFRRVFSELDPATSLADELAIQHRIRHSGLEIVYAADAIVNNRGPETLRELMDQRTRFNTMNLQAVVDHKNDIWSARVWLKHVAQFIAQERPRVDWLVYAAALELYSRLQSWLVYPSRKRYQVWQPLATTKSLVAPDVSRPRQSNR